MAVVNRYTQLPVAQYNPMSFQELAFAPSFLRDRHDKAAEQLGMLQEASNQYNVHDLDAEAASGLVNPLQQNIQQLGETLATQGVNVSQAIPQAMKLKSQYSQMFSSQGGIGQLQARREQIENYKKQLEKQLPQNPELVEAALRNSKLTGSTLTPDGQLQLGEFNPYSTVRHIADEEIMKQLNDAVSKLKPSDLEELGIGISKQKADSFYDLFTATDGKSVSADRIMQLIEANLGPEARNSILQYSELMAGIPRNETVELKDNKGNVREIPAGLAHFYNRMASSANAQAYMDINRQNFLKEDKLAVESINSLSGMSSLQLPGPAIELEKSSSFDNLKYANNRLVSTSKNSAGSHLKDVGNVNEYNYYDSEGNEVPMSRAVERFLPTTGPSLIPVFNKGYRREAKGTDVERIEKDFLKLKESNPVLKEMSKEQALSTLQNYFKDVKTSFLSGNVFNKNYDFVTSSLKNNMPNSTFYDTQGEQLNFKQLSKKTSVGEDELMRSFIPSKVSVRPGLGAVVEGTIKKGDERVNIFMKADDKSSNMASTTTAIADYLINTGLTGKVNTPYTDPSTGESLLGVNTYVINDFKNKPTIIFTGAELKQEELDEMTKNNNPAIIENYFEKRHAKVMKLSDLLDETTDSITQTLQGTKY